MVRRKYEKCVRCGRTIDITNQDRDLCNPCAEELKEERETI